MLTGEEGQGQLLGWAEQRRRQLAGVPAQKEHSWALLSESHLMGLSREHELPKCGFSGLVRAWLRPASLAVPVTCGKMRGLQEA